MKKEKDKKLELRVSSGTAKNKKLKIPEIEDFRAVQEIAKSAVFSIIGDKINGATCLDIFAGSGNMGIEALSRGAGWCDFVDNSGVSIEAIKENIINCGFLENSEVFRKDSVKYVSKTDKKYDIVFADPFYKDTAHKHLISNIKSILNENGIVVFFHGDNLNLQEMVVGTNLSIIDERKFGNSFFTILS
jgi:16S rRNA (guanine(966)-N(2))-methyltransferase RsmD